MCWARWRPGTACTPLLKLPSRASYASYQGYASKPNQAVSVESSRVCVVSPLSGGGVRRRWGGGRGGGGLGGGGRWRGVIRVVWARRPRRGWCCGGRLGPARRDRGGLAGPDVSGGGCHVEAWLLAAPGLGRHWGFGGRQGWPIGCGRRSARCLAGPVGGGPASGGRLVWVVVSVGGWLGFGVLSGWRGCCGGVCGRVRSWL